MDEISHSQVENYRSVRRFATIMWATVKIAIAILLMAYTEFGVYIVIGYILYKIEYSSGLQFLNTQEIELELNTIKQNISVIESRIKS